MTIKSRKIGWMRLVACIGTVVNVYRILVRKLLQIFGKSKFKNRRK
jgi:hypothetical protein